MTFEMLLRRVHRNYIILTKIVIATYEGLLTGLKKKKFFFK